MKRQPNGIKQMLVCETQMKNCVNPTRLRNCITVYEVHKSMQIIPATQTTKQWLEFTSKKESTALNVSYIYSHKQTVEDTPTNREKVRNALINRETVKDVPTNREWTVNRYIPTNEKTFRDIATNSATVRHLSTCSRQTCLDAHTSREDIPLSRGKTLLQVTSTQETEELNALEFHTCKEMPVDIHIT